MFCLPSSKILCVFAALLFIPLMGSTATASGGGASQQYSITARLVVSEHILLGRVTVACANNSSGAIDALYLYLYANRYRDRYSTAAREAAFYHDYRITDAASSERGYIDINSVEVDGAPVSFQVVDTLLRANLPHPLSPGGTLTLTVEFILKIPKLIDRFGYAGGRYEMTDWYPRLAAYGPGGWLAYQSHYLGDPYGDFADYDVTLTLPSDFTVAGTGTVASGDAGMARGRERAGMGPSEASEAKGEPEPLHLAVSPMKTVRFVARQVNDFVWTAGSSFDVEEGALGDIKLACLYPGGNSGKRWRGEALQRLRSTLEWFGREVGPCPFPHVTLVEAPVEKPLAYPMLIFLDEPSAEAVAHGVAEMYFAHVVGTDPVREPWLSEGLAALFARRCMEGAFGPTGVDPETLNFYERRIPRSSARDAAEVPVVAVARDRLDEPISTMAYRFFDLPNYEWMAVDKASLFFEMMEDLVGREVFDRAVRNYYSAWRFKQADREALKRSMEREYGKDLTWFFDAWLAGRKSCDYALGPVKTSKKKGGAGYRSAVTVRRLGGIKMPVEVRVEGASGEEAVKEWDGADDSAVIELETRSKPVRFEVDPQKKLLDVQLLNNSKPKKFRFAFDYPWMDYKPRDAYLVRTRPSAWTNNIDGAKVGGLLTGSSEGRERKLKLGVWAGAKSGNVDWLLQYESPFRALGRRTLMSVRAQKNEGRQAGDVSMQFNLSPRIERKPWIGFSAGFHTFELKDEEYVPADLYDTGVVNKIAVDYYSNLEGYHWQSSVRTGFSFSGSYINSDYHFQRIYASGGVESAEKGVRFLLRGFAGITFDRNTVPKQERFYFNGAGPMEEFEHWYLRSRGSLGREMNYQLPGGGNVRALNGIPVSAKRLMALNLEISKKLLEEPAGRRFAAGLFRDPEAVGFVDSAMGWKTSFDRFESRMVYEVGLGLRWRPSFMKRDYFLRFDFPFFISRPGYEENRTVEGKIRFRWVFSFEKIESR